MFRLIGFLVVVLALGYGGLTLYYGSPEPCEMLAVEQDSMIEELSRAISEDLTTRECVDELWREWFER